MNSKRYMFLKAIEQYLKNIKTMYGYSHSFSDDNVSIMDTRDYGDNERIVIFPGDETGSNYFQNGGISFDTQIEMIRKYDTDMDFFVVSDQMKNDLLESLFGEHFLIVFADGAHEVSVGDYLRGSTSGVFGYVEKIVSDGEWDGSNTGSTWIRRCTGKFQTGESVDIVDGESGAFTIGLPQKVRNIDFPDQTGELLVIQDYTSQFLLKGFEAQEVSLKSNMFISVVMTIGCILEMKNGNPFLVPEV
jgi:hypothetical protein